MKPRSFAAALLRVTALLLLNGTVQAADKVKAVASFSILGDMVHQIGGDRVEVTTLVGPNADAHAYEPKPADVKSVAEAKLLVVNGLGLEGWMSRLEQSSRFKGVVVTASTGVKPQQMKDEGSRSKTVADPHAWQSLANGRIYVQNITKGLAEADPDGREIYEANAAKFVREIDALEAEVTAAIARIPASRRKVITSHDAFGYFGRTYDMEFISPEGVSTESEPSAKDVAKIVRQIRTQKIPAVFMENITDPRLIEQISRETGAKIGGTLYSDALSKPDGPAATYLDMFRYNVETLTKQLAS